MFRFLSLILIAGAFSLPAKGSDFSFSALFCYFSENIYCFDADGKPVKSKNCQYQRKTPCPEIDWKIAADGRYQITDAAGHILQGKPGEQISPCAVLQGKTYLISEAGSPFKTLVLWDPEAHSISPVGKYHAADVFQVIHDGQKLIGIQYIDRHCVFFEPNYASLHQKICAKYPEAFPIWRESAPFPKNRWLVELLLPDRPAVWLLADIATQTAEKISDSPPDLPECGKKQWITYPSRDGAMISAVLSYPADRYGQTALPLVVFPHGGPGSTELPFFDPRVAFLNAHGFLVLQANYRGSAGFGKAFRFQGWQADGIRASLEDIACGAEYLIRSGIADRHRVCILGGSWGGYCALASLCFYPGLYRCGISLFGASDLPGMLRSFPQKSHADAALDRLQYGDVDDPGVAEKLRAISPLFLTGKITSPVFLVHYRQDQVIEFAQSETFYHAMQTSKREAVFISGEGEHGFQPPEKEAEIYRQIVGFIQKHCR